jgi:hypothetical protein
VGFQTRTAAARRAARAFVDQVTKLCARPLDAFGTLVFQVAGHPLASLNLIRL